MSFNYREIFRILKDSFADAFKWKHWRWLLGSFSTSLAVLMISKTIFDVTTKESFIYGTNFLVGLFLLRFILVFLKESLKYLHDVYTNSTYGEAIIILKDSFAQAHAYRKVPGHQDIEFMSAMLTFCNNLKEIYDKITKSDCCVSIKVPMGDIKVDEKAVLINLTRDVIHRDRDTKHYSETKHTLIGNTAFANSFNKFISGNRNRVYINNNVNDAVNYENTSRLVHKEGVLPYNSELVHPIVPIINIDNKNLNCHGFICIDSNKMNVFKGKYDVAIIEGVADGIYDIISQRNEQNKAL